MLNSLKSPLDRPQSASEVSNHEHSNIDPKPTEKNSNSPLVKASIDPNADLSSTIQQGDRAWEKGEFDEAIAYYRQALQLAPNSAKLYHKIALVLKQQGNLEEASQYYRQAIVLNIPPEQASKLELTDSQDSQDNKNSLSIDRLDRNTNNNFEAAQIYLEQAIVYCEQQSWEQAIAACENAIGIVPQMAKAYKVLGNALQQMGKAAEAMGYYAKAIEIQPDLAEAFANVGSLYAQQQKWQQALDYYQKAIALNPEFAGAYRNLAKVWEYLGNADKVLECRYQAIDLEPEKATPQEHWQIANNLFQQGKLEQASRYYRHAIKLNPNFVEAYQQLVEILERLGQWQEVASCYRQLLALKEKEGRDAQRGKGELPIANAQLPKLEEVKTTKLFLNGTVSERSQRLLAGSGETQTQVNGNGKSTQKKWEDALAACLEQVRQQPDSAVLRVNLGTLFTKTKRWSEAIAHFQKALEIDPYFVEAYCSLARIYQKTKRQEKALECWERAQTIEPDRFKAEEHFNLGETLSKQGKLERASACYRRALKLKSKLTQAYLRLGEIHFHNGQKQEAIACYQNAIERNPQNAQAHYFLGQVWTSLQDWDRALPCYQKAIEFQETFWEAYHNLGDVFSKQQCWDKAIATYRRALKINPGFSWSYNNLGDALLKLQRWQEAADAYEAAIALDSDFAWSNYNLGEALVALKQWEKASNAYLRAKAIQADLPEIDAKINRLLTLKVKTEFGSAFECYVAAIERDPTDIESYQKALAIRSDDAQLLIGLANAYLAKNQTENAIESYQKAIAIAPQLAENYSHFEQLHQRYASNFSNSVNGDRLQTTKVFLYPDYRKTNPYQNLLYSKLPDRHTLYAGSIDDAIAAQQKGNCRIVFHLHWTSPITSGANSLEEFERTKNEFIEKLLNFTADGGVLIWTIHNLLPHDCLYLDKEVELRNAICRIASKIHIHSEKSILEVEEVLNLPREKVQVIAHGNYVGVYQNYVTRSSARQRFGFSDKDVVFLFVGQIRPYKGIDELFSAFVEIQKDFPNAHLLVAGNPIHPIRKEAISARARLFRNVTVIEQHLPDEELQWYYNAADAIVLPYRQILTSGSVLNALTFSRPIIAPRVGSIEEIVRDGNNGFLYELGDVKSLVKAMARMAQIEVSERHRLFLEARQSVESYTWEEAATSLFTEINSPIEIAEIAIETETVRCKIWQPLEKSSQEGRVAILILNFINTEDTIGLVQTLVKSSYQKFEIIVIDNDSPNISFRELIQCLGDRTIIRSPKNLGYAGGNNLGIEYVKDKGFEFVWVINPDTTVEESTLDRLVVAAQKRKDISIYGSTICWSHRPDTVWFAGGVVEISDRQCQTYHMYNGQHRDLVPDRIYDVDYVTGASIFCRTRIFNEVGLIPERYFLYFEETDWCLRARQKGHRIAVVPDSVLYHAKRSQVDVLPTKIYFYYYIRGSVLFMLKYFSPDPALVESSISEKFIQPWLQKIREKAPKQAQYFAALAQKALKDGFENITGAIDLLRAFESSESRFLPAQESPVVGCVEMVSEQKISGWVYNRTQPFERLEVTLKIDGQTQVTTLADIQIETLTQHRYGDGNYGFELKPPAILFDSQPHQVEVWVGKNKLNSNLPPVVQFDANPSAYKGRIDGIEQKQIRGWALDLNNPHHPVTVEIVDGDKVILTVECQLDRPDLLKAGLPTSRAGFSVPIPVAYCDGRERSLSLRIAGTTEILSKRPVLMSTDKFPVLTADSLEELWQWLYHYREVSMVHPQNRTSKYLKQIETFADRFASEYAKRPQARLVSIVMPAYNRAKTIKAAIDSTIAQSYRNWELIIVDDGSTDDTVTVVRNIISEYKDNRIIIIPQAKNGGVSRARNVAMQAAKGEIFAYLDSDNNWDKDYLLVMVNMLLDNPWAKIAYCGDRIVQHYSGNHTLETNSEVVSIRLGHFNKSLIENRNYIDLNVFVHWREVYERVGGFREDMRRLVDWELIARYTDYSTPKFVPALLVNYQMGYSDNQITKLENYPENFLKMKQTLEQLGKGQGA